MLNFMKEILPVIQVMPIFVFLILSGICWNSFVRACKGNPTPHDMIKLPLFFLGLDIAFNISWFMWIVGIQDPASLTIGMGRILGIALHLGVATGLIFAVRSLKFFKFEKNQESNNAEIGREDQ
jgi:hypothetical protein|tara:strand:+ start:47107 stop:47478 length:372 start_codon:yes stop_codon:yes gene_type:complete